MEMGESYQFQRLRRPVAIAPAKVAALGDYSSGGGPELESLSVGIGFQDLPAFVRCDGEFIESAVTDARDKAGPNPRAFMQRHGMDARVPFVKVTGNTDGAGVRRPDCKPDTFHTSVPADMGTEHVVNVPVATLGKKVEVEFAERWTVHRPCCS